MQGRSILITGGAGFIGANLAYLALREGAAKVAVLDCLGYAACPLTLREAQGHPAFRRHAADVRDEAACRAVIEEEQPEWLFHLAAETHVDRSIDDPVAFVTTNVTGTAVLLHACLDYWRGLPPARRTAFRFLHSSTDEVFGPLGAGGRFDERSPYAPRSPYAASKAASDHLVRAFGYSYGLPFVLSYCVNNYGPFQFPEKLVPLMAVNALEERELPLYGTGRNVRDWIHVEDHCRALAAAAAAGRPGESYCISADCERSNLEVVELICAAAERLRGAAEGSARRRIRYVEDRPAHDFRYALDAGKLARECGWRPRRVFEEALEETVAWYHEHGAWLAAAARHSGYHRERLGLRARGPLPS